MSVAVQMRPAVRRGSPAGYTTRQVAEALGVSAGRVRALARAGLLEPRRGSRREYRFSFRDLVLARVARELLEAGVSGRRMRRALERLRRQLPAGRSLAAVRLGVEGGRVVVRDAAGDWEPESGQQRLDLEVSELAGKVAPLAVRAATGDPEGLGASAEDWFELGLELEAGAPERAAAAYRAALRLETDHAGAHLNLGRLLHEQGRPAEAERHYRRALAAGPDDPTAAFNLGVALQDLGRPRDALAAYQQALEADAGYADAYYNLAGVCEELGEQAEAIGYLKTYRSLVGLAPDKGRGKVPAS